MLVNVMMAIGFVIFGISWGWGVKYVLLYLSNRIGDEAGKFQDFSSTNIQILHREIMSEGDMEREVKKLKGTEHLFPEIK